MRIAALGPLLLVVACNPPATDDYVARIGVEDRRAPSSPIASPDTDGAVWAPSPGDPQRLLYGKPGARVLFALQCSETANGPRLSYTRYEAADPGAKAVLALIGNGHVTRLKIDAQRDGSRWLWRGSEPAVSGNFEGLTGGRQVEATVPGAGSLILNPSPLPGDLILRCRQLAQPTTPASTPAEAGGQRRLQPGTTYTAAPPPLPAR